MTRVLRYPRLSTAACMAVMAGAAARDACVGAGLSGWSHVLLVATAALLVLSVGLLSCRFFVDEIGVGVGFLLRVRRTTWEDIASFGLLCCNSRRRYFYGMYDRATDFINLIHRAPQCGSWGFVVPVSRKLMRAVSMYCPFPVDLAPHPKQKREGRLRAQWHQAAVYSAFMLPGALVAFVTGTLMMIQSAHGSRASVTLPLLAMILYLTGVTLLYRMTSTISTCPGFNEQGVCAGRGIYLPWEDVRFGYVHRLAQMSGFFLLSQPLETIHKRGAPPIFCLSMPDTTTMLLAYLTYCPHASKGMEV